MKIGIIGCGQIVRLRHAPECVSHPDVELAGFYDLVYDRAVELSGQFGGKPYETIDDMLADDTVDGVIVCTANATHAQVSIAALQAGKHVLCEKPMAIRLDQAQQMAEASKKSGKLLMAAHNQRFDKVHVRAKKLLQAGAIGNVISFRTEFSHGGAENWSITQKKSWFFRKDEAAFGAVADLGVHKVDLMRWMLEDEFVSVSALVKTLEKKDANGTFVGVDDNAAYLLMTKNHVMGTLYASWSNHGRMDNSTTIYGSGGVMRIYDPLSSDEIVIYSDVSKGEMRFHIEPQERSGMVDSFVDAVLSGKGSPVSPEEAIAGLKVIFAAQESEESGKIVKIG